MSVTIESHEDDSVTLTVGTLTAKIRGASWQEANDAAHTLAALLTSRIEMKNLRSKAQRLTDTIQYAAELLDAVTRKLEETERDLG